MMVFVSMLAMVVALMLFVPFSAKLFALFLRIEGVLGQFGAAVMEEMFACSSAVIVLVFGEGCHASDCVWGQVVCRLFAAMQLWTNEK